MNPTDVAALIRTALPDAIVQVHSEDNTHYAARVVSASFAGQRSLVRHQAVYRALGGRVGGEIHALSIEALTPAEWAAAQGIAGGASPGGVSRG